MTNLWKDTVALVCDKYKMSLVCAEQNKEKFVAGKWILSYMFAVSFGYMVDEHLKAMGKELCHFCRILKETGMAIDGPHPYCPPRGKPKAVTKHLFEQIYQNMNYTDYNDTVYGARDKMMASVGKHPDNWDVKVTEDDVDEFIAEKSGEKHKIELEFMLIELALYRMN